MAKSIDGNVDYYELLGVEITAELKEITKAYRTKALKVHPDKNPSPDAAQLFHKLSKAYEILKDRNTRSQYDQIYKGQLEQKKKRKEMDAKRRAAQEELEEREQAAKKVRTEQMQAEAQFRAELARMRAEGAERRREDMAEPEPIPEPAAESNPLDCALKFKWKRKNHAWTTEELTTLLNPIGKVDTVAISDKGKKRVNALVAFATVVDAHAVMTHRDIHPELNAFESIDWASGQEPALVTRMNEEAARKRDLMQATKEARAYVDRDRLAKPTGKPLFSSAPGKSIFSQIKIPNPPSTSTKASGVSDDDFEAMVQMGLRQAERDRQLRQSTTTTSSSTSEKTS